MDPNYDIVNSNIFTNKLVIKKRALTNQLSWSRTRSPTPSWMARKFRASNMEIWPEVMGRSAVRST